MPSSIYVYTLVVSSYLDILMHTTSSVAAHHILQSKRVFKSVHHAFLDQSIAVLFFQQNINVHCLESS